MQKYMEKCTHMLFCLFPMCYPSSFLKKLIWSHLPKFSDFTKSMWLYIFGLTQTGARVVEAEYSYYPLEVFSLTILDNRWNRTVYNAGNGVFIEVTKLHEQMLF